MAQHTSLHNPLVVWQECQNSIQCVMKCAKYSLAKLLGDFSLIASEAKAGLIISEDRLDMCPERAAEYTTIKNVQDWFYPCNG